VFRFWRWCILTTRPKFGVVATGALRSSEALENRRARWGSVAPSVSALTVEKKIACFPKFRQRLTAARGEELVRAVAGFG
jgi:hypothetical protein